jgi:hypothetical protein
MGRDSIVFTKRELLASSTSNHWSVGAVEAVANIGW